jgi:hypothetical protein
MRNVHVKPSRRRIAAKGKDVEKFVLPKGDFQEVTEVTVFPPRGMEDDEETEPAKRAKLAPKKKEKSKR